MSVLLARKRWWLSTLALVAVVLFATGAFFSKSSIAAPVVSWKPASITDTVSPGTTQTIPISFTASANLTNAVISIVPALQGLVHVTPSTIATIQKGQTIPLTLRVSAPASAPLAVTQGTVQVRVGSPTIAQPLPVQIIVASDAVGLLPPDPGAAGMTTLAGIDSDNDGVRDDIERYIWLTFPASAKTREALIDFSIAMQAAVLSGGSSDAASLAADKVDRTQDCLWYMHAPNQVWQALIAQYINTSDRYHAYSDYNRLLNGRFSTLTPVNQLKSRCGFDPDTLPN